MKENILKLRSEGKTYNEIVDILKCSKSTVSYHCGEGQKEKNRKRTNSTRNKNPFIGKTEKFRGFEFKIRDFQKEGFNWNDKKRNGLNYTVEDVKKYIGDNPKCYLTGRDIDIFETTSYHFDHIIPRKKGGDNTLDNLGIACKEANMAKSDMNLNEFIDLCKEVLVNFGYSVEKNV